MATYFRAGRALIPLARVAVAGRRHYPLMRRGVSWYRRVPARWRRPVVAVRAVTTAATLWCFTVFGAVGALTSAAGGPAPPHGAVPYGFYLAAGLSAGALVAVWSHRYELGVGCFVAMLAVGLGSSVFALVS